MAHAALQRLVADRHDHGRLADRLEKRRRCLEALSNDQLVRLGSILVTMAERLAESVDCEVDASLEGTKRLEQEFSRVRRTLNNNDTNDRFTGKITRLLNQDLDSPVAEPKVTDPARHSPVGGAVLRALDVADAIDLDLSPLEARTIADGFITDPSRATGILHYIGDQLDARGGQVWPVETAGADRGVLLLLSRDHGEAEPLNVDQEAVTGDARYEDEPSDTSETLSVVESSDDEATPSEPSGDEQEADEDATVGEASDDGTGLSDNDDDVPAGRAWAR
jgi:hypothetical protein